MTNRNLLCSWKTLFSLRWLRTWNKNEPLKHRTDLPAPHHRWVWYMAIPRDWTLPTSTLRRPTRQTWWRSRPQTQTLMGASAAGSMPVCSGSTRYTHRGDDEEMSQNFNHAIYCTWGLKRVIIIKSSWSFSSRPVVDVLAEAERRHFHMPLTVDQAIPRG